MFRYFLKRTLAVIPTILIVSVFVFMFVRFIPGDPARRVAGPDATLEDVENIRETLGLNKSIPEQYKDYMLGLMKGDMGTSLKTQRPVTYEIGQRYMNTVRLTVVSLLWSVIAGVLIGVFSGKNRSKWQDYTGMTLAVSGISVPSFWLGLMLISVFAVNLKWFPTVGSEGLKSLVLPSITLGASVAAIIARFTRSSIIEILKEDYIRTARAKGLRENKVVWKHVFRNSMIAVVTVVGLQFGFLLGGSVVTESVFAFPGLGSLLIDSVNFRDYPMIQSLILIFSLHFVVINLVIDLLYAGLNPEIQMQ
ncbi:ABC transporter permease subunit [Tissierella creatinophila]|uniref:Glutathione transport system permease protein GsiC n=1 Tax=Tissierella creatinophila DSM 6911 TaxID=1123403 RepID=A0A1U7M5Q2_TISCR|nr:ABC transporter permease subunit [Tissierella creatinophila]OLS02654.1 glutathione transport system permease protein GsiC [Tissierella creatinophila DSM 6911]